MYLHVRIKTSKKNNSYTSSSSKRGSSGSKSGSSTCGTNRVKAVLAATSDEN